MPLLMNRSKINDFRPQLDDLGGNILDFRMQSVFRSSWREMYWRLSIRFSHASYWAAGFANAQSCFLVVRSTPRHRVFARGSGAPTVRFEVRPAAWPGLFLPNRIAWSSPTQQ